MDADQPALSFLGRHLPAAFERLVLVLAPGDVMPYDEIKWHGALVVVERGQVELECLDDSRHRFGRGAVISLGGLPLRALRSAGRSAAVLVAVRRRDAEADS
jgi:hypothetical protein